MKWIILPLSVSDEGEVATPETAEADVEAEATALTTPWATIPIKD